MPNPNIPSIRRRLAQLIRGGPKPFDEMSMDERRAMWPAATDLTARHLQNCRVLENRLRMLDLMPKNAVCAEIGIDRGEFSAAILERASPATLHLIDISEEAVANALRRFPQEIAGERITLHGGDSKLVLSRFPAAYFDWVYIDGDHTYEAVRADLAGSLRALKPGGIIALNDYTFFAPSDFSKYGVMEAVHEFCLAQDFEFIYLALQGRGYHDVGLRGITSATAQSQSAGLRRSERVPSA